MKAVLRCVALACTLCLGVAGCRSATEQACQQQPSAQCIVQFGSRIMWRDVTLDAPDLRDSALPHVTFWRAAFVRGQFDGANLRYAHFHESTLTGSSFRAADLSRAKLERAHLENADFTGAILARATLSEAHLVLATLARADLRNALLRHADLEGASLAGAHLEHANLTDANLKKTDLRGAALSGAQLGGALLDGALWTDGRQCASHSRGLCKVQ